MSNNKVNTNKMETSPVFKLIIQMAIPPLISMFMQYSYNLVDCIFVAQINEKALTAVSLVFPITTLMSAVAIWIGVGVNVLISTKLGCKDQNGANNIVTTGVLVATVVGVILNVIVLLIAKPFISSFTNDDEIMKLAIHYLSVFAFTGIPCTVHLCIQKIIQGTGNMLAPMWFQIAGVVFNFIFDPILIFGYFGFPKLGVYGAAAASVGGYIVSMILAFYVLLFCKQKVQLKVREFPFSKSYVKEIFVLGFPSFVMNALGAFMTYFTNSILVVYSTTTVAFFGAYFKIQQVVTMTLNGLIQGCIPVMSYNYGAKNEKRLREVFRCGTWISIILTGISILLLWSFPAQILKAFNASSNMMSFGITALRIMCSSYIFAAVSTMIASFMQSTRNVGISVLINLFRQFLFLFPSMWLFSNIWGINGVWISFVIAEVLTFLCGIIFYKKRSIHLN
ncbi:MAG: MATE family efflux transporter [bacterium]|nr:MATE family efflux transporter [bacterium]